VVPLTGCGHYCLIVTLYRFGEQRHAFKSEYRVGFLPDGKLVGLDLMLYCNAGSYRCVCAGDHCLFRCRFTRGWIWFASGWSSDLSYAVMDRALFSCTNAYKLGAVRAVGHVCRTNIASHTAFRGFGSPQGMFVIESIIERVAQIVGKPPEDVRQLNFIREGG
jgi:xanthine dehydrogenase molybdopterin-binding subunit B